MEKEGEGRGFIAIPIPLYQEKCAFVFLPKHDHCQEKHIRKC